MYLDLSSCDLSSLDAGILAAELTENATVKNLILARNPIGPAGVEVIAKACQGKASLTNLQLSFTMMGLHGARALGRTLAMKQTAIHTLKLTDNHIGDGGARGLARALRVNTTLTSLALDGNHIMPRLSHPPSPKIPLYQPYHSPEMKSGTLARRPLQRFYVAVAQS